MAIVKSSGSITQMTASGTSTTVPVGATLSPYAVLLHSNGSGAVSAAGSAQIQYQFAGSAVWHTDLPAITFTTTTGGTLSQGVLLPDAVSNARAVYTAPTGPTGYTLDMEIGWVTP